jgi:hypothetical protein
MHRPSDAKSAIGLSAATMLYDNILSLGPMHWYLNARSVADYSGVLKPYNSIEDHYAIHRFLYEIYPHRR